MLGINHNGTGVEQNFGAAASWYKLAANNHHVPSMMAMASLYRQGRGVPRDLQQAAAWIKRADAARANQ